MAKQLLKDLKEFLKQIPYMRLKGNYLPKKVRYVGFEFDYYDGPYYCLGLYWGHFYFSYD